MKNININQRNQIAKWSFIFVAILITIILLFVNCNGYKGICDRENYNDRAAMLLKQEINRNYQDSSTMLIVGDTATFLSLDDIRVFTFKPTEEDLIEVLNNISKGIESLLDKQGYIIIGDSIYRRDYYKFECDSIKE